ncbi:putative non-specific serine/threonine protein kinase [Helianthus annuus]|nr:putative non-specific serine/threonine protein kinase [Helianthus annuus]
MSSKMRLIGGALLLFTGLAILAYFLWIRKKKHGDEAEEIALLEINNEIEMGASRPRSFSYHELARSTADFAETEKLGEGGFGGVYKGFSKRFKHVGRCQKGCRRLPNKASKSMRQK